VHDFLFTERVYIPQPADGTKARTDLRTNPAHDVRKYNARLQYDRFEVQLLTLELTFSTLTK